ncbi:GNAT family N-acetyltransferase [Paludibaculum fermentans]|uniref:GNAT family N-acetyltransferase n=1 Tax=Paludibaculum fermentans TaxID=1473598 RepID=UPI003EB97353
MIPVIETERLRLRGHRLEDFVPSAAMWADPAVTRFIGGRPFSEEEAWVRFLRYAGHWQYLGFGYWLVEERATGRFLGEVGFADWKREIEPPIQGIPEVGWVMVPPAQGKGYATEAVRAALAWRDVELGVGRTVCLIHPENAASMRVAEKCGFQEYSRTVYKGHATVLLERRA